MKLIPENLQWLPFHSLIVSSLSISELSQHLGRFSLCQTDFDEQILILRWADTRILPIMAAELETSDTAEFLRPILMWCYPDYSGHWHILHGQNQPYIKTHHLLKISQKSFNQMLNSSSIYASWNLFCSKLDDMDWDEQIRLCPQFLWAHFQQEYTQVDHDAPMFYINEFIEQTLAKLKTKQPEILSQPFPHLFDTPQK